MNDVAHELVQVTKLTRKISRRRGGRINRLILEEIWKHMRILRELIDVADVESSEILESFGTKRLVLYNQWLTERYQQRLFTIGMFCMLASGSDATEPADTTSTEADTTVADTTATEPADTTATEPADTTATEPADTTETKPNWPFLSWILDSVVTGVAKFANISALGKHLKS
jgi:hypothetical protein